MSKAKAAVKRGQGTLCLTGEEKPIESTVSGVTVYETPHGQLSILPEWNGAHKVLILPNSLLRGGVFGVSQNSAKEFLNRVSIPCVAGIEIRYSGPRLTQSDLDVWHGTLVISKTPCSDGYAISGVKPFLKMIERQTGKAERDWLKSSLTKLVASAIEVSHNGLTYVGSLIDDFYQEEETGRLRIKLNPTLAALFAPASWTAINWNQRSALQRKALAQWIHAFYSTHRTPFYYRVETIMVMCGSKHKSVVEFRRALKEALADVADVTGWECRIDKAGDAVVIIKQGLPSPDESHESEHLQGG